MKIAEIRATIDTLNWNRQDATGGTRSENQRTDLPARLEPHISAVEALVIAPRFERDIENQWHALENARVVLTRWRVRRDDALEATL